MFKKFKHQNWGTAVPQNICEYLMTPTSIHLRIVYFLFQKIFRINSDQTFMVHFTSIVSGNVELGDNVVRYVAGSPGCYIQGINGVFIGSDTMIAPGVKIISANHEIGEHFKHIDSNPIMIGKNCWIASNSVILSGVTLGDNVTVGAGCVVTKSFPSNCIIGGVPAKVIKYKN
jgi:acetyltransferase-like isoleucine patch superfamily enzyme